MKNKKIIFIVTLLISIFLSIFIYNDDFLYSKEIMKIDKITTEKEQEEQNSLGLKEKYYYKRVFINRSA